MKEILRESKTHILQRLDNYNFAIREKLSEDKIKTSMVHGVEMTSLYKPATRFYGRLKAGLESFHRLTEGNEDYPEWFKIYKNVRPDSELIEDIADSIKKL